MLATWFNRIPEKTIVWSANGINLVQRGSKVLLTAEGHFVLNDPEGKQIWDAGSGVSYAAMLDTGNFVLVGEDSATLWESFGVPTDIILPTQVLNQGSRLVARFSETNYSIGRFMFILQNDRNLVMYTRNFPMDSNNFPCWSTQTVDTGFQLIFNQSGYIVLTAKNQTILNRVSSSEAAAVDFYQRATLEYDGVFRQYVYPKSAQVQGFGPWHGPLQPPELKIYV